MTEKPIFAWFLHYIRQIKPRSLHKSYMGPTGFDSTDGRMFACRDLLVPPVKEAFTLLNGENNYALAA